MPNVSTERRQDEAGARKEGAAHSCTLAVAGPSFGEEGEQKRHGKVHDAIGCCANNTCNLAGASKFPMVPGVLLQDAIAHGEAYDFVRASLTRQENIGTPDW